jgi:cytochrome c peroxidase
VSGAARLAALVAGALALLVSLVACDGGEPAASDSDASASRGSGGDGAGGAPGGGSGPAGGEDPGPPTFDDEELAIIAALAPPTLPAPPPDISNAWADDPDAAVFGQAIFFDPLFSGRLIDGDNDGSEHALGHEGETGKVACAGCHLPEAGFLDDRSLGGQISLAAGWVLRRTPSLLDVAQGTLLTWGGRHDAFYNQIFGPIESPLEMNSSRLFFAQEIFRRHRAAYEALFGPMPALDDPARFPQMTADTNGCKKIDVRATLECHGNPGDGAEYDSMAPSDQEAVTRVMAQVGKALGAYQRLLSCGQGRFDAWAHGDAGALDASEQRGLEVFIGKGKCVGCHSGPYLSDQAFHNVGLMPEMVAVVFIDDGDRGAGADLAAALTDPLNVKGIYSDGDDGRLPESVSPAMEGAFKTPTLRCVERRPSFFHTGHVKTLAGVVEHFDEGGDAFGYPGTSEIAPLGLTERERADLVAFLEALGGPGPDAHLLAPPLD